MTGSVQMVAEYGARGASARVRLHEWDEYLGLGAVHHSYRGSRTNKMREMLASPRELIEAEWKLRRAVREFAGATVVLSRAATPLSSGGIESRILCAAARSVYDFDDALMVPREDWTRYLFDRSAQWRRSVEAADAVIAGNDMLAQEASRFNSQVEMIPSCVNTDDYPKRFLWEFDRPPRLVWIGTPATEHYLKDLAPSVNRLYEQSGITLLVISSGSADLPGFNPGAVRRRQWSRQHFVADLYSGDIGVMPLENSKWEEGKCAYKLLQYGAAGLPVVASPVGANRVILEKMGGASAQSPEQWFDEISGLINAGPSERFSIGQRSRKLVDSQYSYAARAAQWCALVGV